MLRGAVWAGRCGGSGSAAALAAGAVPPPLLRRQLLLQVCLEAVQLLLPAGAAALVAAVPGRARLAPHDAGPIFRRVSAAGSSS
jgi:hypothetical protein